MIAMMIYSVTMTIYAVAMTICNIAMGNFIIAMLKNKGIDFRLCKSNKGLLEVIN